MLTLTQKRGRMNRTSLFQLKGMGKLLLLLMILIWTGILLGGLHRQYHLLKRAETTFHNSIVQCGFSGLRLLQENNTKNTMSGTSPLLQYMQQEKERRQEEAWRIVGAETLGRSDVPDSGESAEPDTQTVGKDSVLVFNNGTYDITDGNGQKASATKSPASANDQEKTKTVDATNNTKSNMTANEKKIATLKAKKDRNYLLDNFYIVDSSTSIDKKVFQVSSLLQKSLKLKKEKKPQILIYHTHGASEGFVDSKKGDTKDGIIGVGEELASILTKQYGYHVIHDETSYDLVNGSIDRNKAYNQSCAGVTRMLQKYPSIQVVIDLHRDGVGNKVHRLTTINGKRTAQVMFFNGLSRNKKGNIAYLHNDNLQANLAFSLQMKIACMENYPDFAKPIYLKNYRYNLHLRERSLLIELGNENNTVQEAKNAMEPLAKTLHQVLSGQ